MLNKPETETMTEAERAFAAYFRGVCYDARRERGGPPVTDDFLCATWHEALADWLAAVEWGQRHPKATAKPSRVWKQRLTMWLKKKEKRDDDMADW